MIRRVILVWTAIALFVAVASMGARNASAARAAAGREVPDAQGATGQTSKPAPAKPTPAQPAAPAKPATAKPATPQGGRTAKPPAAPARGPVAPTSPGAGPVIVVDTVKGVFEFETYPKEAPKTVAHILALVKRNFYNGQRVHRVVPGFVIQFGDPRSHPTKPGIRDGSGKPVGVAEISRMHKVGAVAMAHAGDASQADSQMYVALTLERTRGLDGDYTVFGQVISGMDVVEKIVQNDVIRRVTVREQTPAPAK